MVIQEEGLVISKTSYGDSAIIANIFTLSKGLVGFYIPGIRAKRGKAKAFLFNPLQHLGFAVDYRDMGKLEKLKELELLFNQNAIYADPVKQSVALFYAEVLSKCIQPNHPDSSLFGFICNEIHRLEHTQSLVGLPILFLMRLSEVLGFAPDDSPNQYFDLNSGCFVNELQLNSTTLNEVESSLMMHCLTNKTVALSSEQRSTLLKIWLDYFNIHYPGSGTLKSLEIIKAVLYH